MSALTFLAADRELLRKFLEITGLGPGNLQNTAAEPALHGSVLEYLIGDEQVLVRFAAHAGVAPEAVAQAHQALCPGCSMDPP